MWVIGAQQQFVRVTEIYLTGKKKKAANVKQCHCVFVRMLCRVCFTLRFFPSWSYNPPRLTACLLMCLRHLCHTVQLFSLLKHNVIINKSRRIHDVAFRVRLGSLKQNVCARSGKIILSIFLLNLLVVHIHIQVRHIIHTARFTTDLNLQRTKMCRFLFSRSISSRNEAPEVFNFNSAT